MTAASEVELMVITRFFDAPPALVWKAWTTPEYAKQWWGPKDFTIPVYTMDFRVGGKFHLCMRSPDGSWEGWTAGEYLEIVPLKKIAFSMYFSDPDGNKVDPATMGIVHEVVDEAAPDFVTFEDLGDGKTRVTYTGNEPMASAKESGQYEAMEQSLAKFADVLTDLA